MLNRMLPSTRYHLFWTIHIPTPLQFWFRNLVTVMLPFALLLCLNVAIIRRLHRQHQSAKLFRFGTSAHRVRLFIIYHTHLQSLFIHLISNNNVYIQRNVRSATLSLICVTCTYLASNLLNVVLNLTEFIDRVIHSSSTIFCV